jgi:thioesterase domain-containing protein
MEQIFFRRPHPFSRRQLAELVWTVSNRNILDFLAGVPRERWRTVRFEELVREPARVLAGICEFLEIELRPEMAEPYRPGVARMVDGPHAVSRMLGDVKFLSHGRVNPAAAEGWRAEGETPLGAAARGVAADLEYLRPLSPGRGALVSLQAGVASRRPLFCVHPVGGEVLAYRELARRLGPDQPVYGLQSPEPPGEDLRTMAALYIAAVRGAQPRGPYRLLGWSMGGVVAYEMARQLTEHGADVELLAVVDAGSPLLFAAEPALSELDLVATFALDLARLSGRPVPDVDLSGLDEEGAFTRIFALGHESGVFGPGVEEAEVRRLLDRFRANRRALSSYPPLSYSGEVLLFRATEHPPGEEDLGWSNLVSDLKTFELPGDHYSILRGPGAEVLAETLWQIVPFTPAGAESGPGVETFPMILKP